MRAAVRPWIVAACVVLFPLASGCKGGEEAPKAPETAVAQPAAPAPAAPAAPAPVAAPAPTAPAVLAVGASVAAPWGGGMYLGTVKTLTGDSADVLYADDQQTRTVKVAELKLVAPQAWKVGDKVSAVWTSGKFYGGTITADKGNGSYTVAWTDGSAPSDVVAAKIMVP